MKKFRYVFLAFAFVSLMVPLVNAKAATVDELVAQITALQVQIQQLQQQLTQARGEQGTAWCYDFKVNLRYGDDATNPDVAALQKALEKEGLYKIIPQEDGYFGDFTASAVTGFQQKYKDEVLNPLGLKYGTGFAGNATRVKLNKLYGCKQICAQVITYAKNPSTTPTQCKAFSTSCDVPTGWIKVDSCPSTTIPLIIITPTNLIQGQTYNFSGKLENATPNSGVSFYLKSPNGTMQENGRFIGKTDSLGKLFIEATQTIYKGAQIGTYTGWVKVSKALPGDLYEDYESNKVSFQVSSSSTTACTDSDGGKNYYTKGAVVDGGKSYTDYCFGAFALREYFCLGISDLGLGGVAQEDYICPNGGSCQDGACVAQNQRSLVSWWKFENNILDTQGNNNGVSMVGATYAAGKTGQGLSCDGYGDYVNIGDKDSLEPQQLTLSFWAKLNNPSLDFEGGIAKGKVFGASYEFSYRMDFHQGLIRAGITNTADTYFGVTAPVDNQWHFWAMGVENGIINLYKDGGLAATTNYNGVIDYTKSYNKFVISTSDMSSDAWLAFNGTIDEVKFWNYALSSSQILNEYNSITPPSITVLSPNGGESWRIGETKKVSWTASGVNYVRIYIEDDTITGSGSTNYIYDGTISAAQGYYDWTIVQNQLPGSSTLPRNYKIRIDGVNTPTSGEDVVTRDWSNAKFTILNPSSPSITVLSPNGGEKWEVGKTYTIKYQILNKPASLSGGWNISIKVISEKSISEKNEWDARQLSYLNLIDDKRAIDWTIPLPSTDDLFSLPLGSYRIKVALYQDVPSDNPMLPFIPSVVRAEDVSDAPFSIVAASTQLPNLTAAPILFTPDKSVYSKTDSLTIEVVLQNIGTKDAGPFYLKYRNKTNNWDLGGAGFAGLKAGEKYVDKMTFSDLYWVKDNSENEFEAVIDSKNEAIESNENDNILTRKFKVGIVIPSITVLSPNGGEQWAQGSTHNITWNSTGVNNVMIELDKNSPNTGWHLTYSVPASSGSFSWAVPSNNSTITTGSDYKINIWDTTNPSVTDSSDNYFSIVAAGGLGTVNIESQLASIGNAISVLIENIKFLIK